MLLFFKVELSSPFLYPLWLSVHVFGNQISRVVPQFDTVGHQRVCQVHLHQYRIEKKSNFRSENAALPTFSSTVYVLSSLSFNSIIMEPTTCMCHSGTAEMIVGHVIEFLLICYQIMFYQVRFDVLRINYSHSCVIYASNALQFLADTTTAMSSANIPTIPL